MNNKFVDVLYKITIGILVLAVLISIGYIIFDGGDTVLFINGIRLFLLLPGMFLSPFIVLITLIDRIFFHKFNTKNFYKVLVINIIYIILALTAPDPFSGLNMI